MEYQGKTQQQWLDAINAYTVDSVISFLVPRVASGPFVFNGVANYANLVMQNKPVLDVFTDELPDYVAEEIARINAVFATLTLQEDIKTRLAALVPYLSQAAALESLADTNMALLEKRIIEQTDTVLLSSLEGRVAAIQAENAKEAGIGLALKAREGGKRIVAYMNALNAAKTPTTAQVKSVLQDADLVLIKALLESGSLRTAKEEIEAYSPSGIITADDKTAIIGELDRILAL